MSSSEYIANFFLVIIGFAVSELLRGSARFIRERHLIKFYWPALVIIPAFLEMMMFVFLKLFTLVADRTDPDWSLEELIVTSLIVIPFAFMSYLMFPSRIKEGFDMKKFYLDNARVIIIIAMAQMTVVMVMMAFMAEWGRAAGQVVTIALSAVVLRNFERFHLIWLITMIVMMNILMFVLMPINI